MTLYTVVGASGFIGSRLVSVLRDEGHEVYAPARGDQSIVQHDLGRVFYCAGLTSDYSERPFDTVEAHVTLLANLLDSARFERLVYLSSTRLYDSLQTAKAEEDALLRLNPSSPRHLYDLSKALGENLCLTRSGGRASVARLSGVFDWRPGSPGFLSLWLHRARHARTLLLASASGTVRDYIYIEDAIGALRAILDSDLCKIFNVATGENLSNGELAGCFARHGWETRFTQYTQIELAPTCLLTGLKALGIQPRSVTAVLDYILELEPFHAAR